MPETTFAELINEHNSNWHLENGHLYVIGNTKENADFKVLVPATLLNAEHPDLGAALNAAFKWNKFNTAQWSGCISPYYVRQTLDNLRDPVPSFLSTDGIEWRLKEVANFMVYDSNPPQVWLKGARQRIVTAQEQGRKVSFVQETKYDGWYADIRALDADYPGWEKRYFLGRELGVRTDELFDYVFSANPSPGTELPPISFDG